MKPIRQQSSRTIIASLRLLCILLASALTPGLMAGCAALLPASPAEFAQTPTPDATATAASRIIAAALAPATDTPAPPMAEADSAAATAPATGTATAAATATALATATLAPPATATPDAAATTRALDAALSTAVAQTLTAQPTPTHTATATPNATATAAALAAEVARQVAATLTAAARSNPPTSTATPVPITVMPPTATPLPAPTSTPRPVACSVAVSGELAFLWDQVKIGCPTGNAALVWSSWTPFERGQMMWRDDTRQIYGFFNSGWWQSTPDVWDGQSATQSRGAPPPGLLEPVRGTGHIWGINDRFFQELGWARTEQKGFCALVQNFENGFVLRSSQVEFCKDNLFNRAREGDFPLNYLVANYGGGWYAGLK